MKMGEKHFRHFRWNNPHFKALKLHVFELFMSQNVLIILLVILTSSQIFYLKEFQKVKGIFKLSSFENEINFIENVNVIFFHTHTISWIFRPILQLRIKLRTVSNLHVQGFSKVSLLFSLKVCLSKILMDQYKMYVFYGTRFTWLKSC